jgi:hypothetical protein
MRTWVGILVFALIALSWSSSCSAAEESDDEDNEDVPDVNSEDQVDNRSARFYRWVRHRPSYNYHHHRPGFVGRPYYPQRRVEAPHWNTVQPQHHRGSGHRTGYREDDIGYAAILG